MTKSPRAGKGSGGVASDKSITLQLKLLSGLLISAKKLNPKVRRAAGSSISSTLIVIEGGGV